MYQIGVYLSVCPYGYWLTGYSYRYRCMYQIGVNLSVRVSICRSLWVLAEWILVWFKVKLQVLVLDRSLSVYSFLWVSVLADWILVQA
jgi:hypothetical protein